MAEIWLFNNWLIIPNHFTDSAVLLFYCNHSTLFRRMNLLIAINRSGFLIHHLSAIIYVCESVRHAIELHVYVWWRADIAECPTSRRSGRHIVPPLAWWTTERIQIDPITNSTHIVCDSPLVEAKHNLCCTSASNSQVAAGKTAKQSTSDAVCIKKEESSEIALPHVSFASNSMASCIFIVFFKNAKEIPMKIYPAVVWFIARVWDTNSNGCRTLQQMSQQSVCFIIRRESQHFIGWNERPFLCNQTLSFCLLVSA